MLGDTFGEEENSLTVQPTQRQEMTTVTVAEALAILARLAANLLSGKQCQMVTASPLDPPWVTERIGQMCVVIGAPPQLFDERRECLCPQYVEISFLRDGARTLVEATQLNFVSSRTRSAPSEG